MSARPSPRSASDPRGCAVEADGAFDLTRTLLSGQVFHWEPVGDGWAGTVGSRPVFVAPRTGGGTWVEPATDAGQVARYFALDHPLEAICATFPTDPFMAEARAACAGLRVIRQPAWECLATFITSSMKQVGHIRAMSHALRRRFGEVVGQVGPVTLWAYPDPARIAAATEAELRAAGLGWRAPHLLATAREVAAGRFDLEAVRGLDDAAAHRALATLPGVGPKVANCVLLFAYERLEAFPIDVWIERVLRTRYFAGRRGGRVHAAELRAFARNHFGAYGGYAQQYLFHHARTSARAAASPAPAGRRVRESSSPSSPFSPAHVP